MLYFFDTSALVKRYHHEIGSSTVIKIFEEENQILLANLALAEFVSALNRIKNRKQINENDLHLALNKFALDISLNNIGIIEITTEHILHSYELIMKNNLSSNDAIILATALGVKDFEPIFVCADIRSGLLKAAQENHLSTLNPLSEE